MGTKESYLVVFSSKLFEREFNLITISVLRTESDKSRVQYSFFELCDIYHSWLHAFQK